MFSVKAVLISELDWKTYVIIDICGRTFQSYDVEPCDDFADHGKSSTFLLSKAS